VRIEEGQRAQELFLAAIGPFLRFAEQIPALKEYAASMMSDTTTATLQAGEWQELVRQWVGMPSLMEPMEVNGSAAMLPGLTVPTHSWLSVTNRRACAHSRETFTSATFEKKPSSIPRHWRQACRSRTRNAGPPHHGSFVLSESLAK